LRALNEELGLNADGLLGRGGLRVLPALMT